MEIDAAVRAARSGAALFDLSGDFSQLTLTGADRESFLHALTSNDVLRLPVGQFNRQALLSKKSTVIADFLLCKQRDELILLVRHPQARILLQTLEQYHFSEDVTFSLRQTAVLQVSGESAPALFDGSGIPSPFEPGRLAYHTFAEIPCLTLSHSYTGDPGWLFVCDPEHAASLKDHLKQIGASEGAVAVFETLRIEAGELVMGRDFDESNLLLELGLGERIVSQDKGCYPGQEVVARVSNRGRIGRRLMGLVAVDGKALPASADITHEEKPVGQVRSACWSPTLQAFIAIALLRHDLAVDGADMELRIGDEQRSVRIASLPFHRSPAFRRRAQNLYNDGMATYHASEFGSARQKFEAAIAIEGRYADAWEALAMTAEKMGNLDEAIVLNRRYGDLDPDAIMAHTNLSRLYMLKGFKERAEEEKGKATLIEFRLKARRQGITNVAPADDSARLAAEAAERERKLAIFRQVLDMDAADEIANFGIGKLYLEAGDYERAIGHLRAVIAANGEYSAAWELLGRALAKNGDFDEAIVTLRQGIDVATRRGDLMPAGAMKESLKILTSHNLSR